MPWSWLAFARLGNGSAAKTLGKRLRSGIYFAPFTPQCVCKRKDAIGCVLVVHHEFGCLKRYSLHALGDLYQSPKIDAPPKVWIRLRPVKDFGSALL